jgi:glycosyltransferase involved in cell wall biosynthesis
VDRFVANSQHVRERIRRIYDRDASVVHPPVDVERFRPADRREDFYLVVSALVPYKLVDLAVRTFARLDRPLVVVGSGPERARLRALAGPRTRFTGWLPDAEVADLMGRCRALVMPGVEDFGIVPVEAQAAGAPVIALAAGGALETVVAGERADATGVLFGEATEDALADAVLALDRLRFDPRVLRQHAQRFGRDRFLDAMRAEVAAVLAGPVPDTERPAPAVAR